MKKSILGLIAAVLVVPVLACSFGPSLNPSDIITSFLPATATPTSAPASPTTARAAATIANPAATSAPSPAATATNAPAASAGYDGDWRGTSDPNALPLNFNISNNKVTQANINWSIKVGSCSIGGGFSDTPKDSSITGKTFVAHLSSSGLDFTFQGTFASDTDASGTIEWKGKHEFCGDVPLTQVKWSAKKGGSTTSNPTNPTSAPRPTVAASNPNATPTYGPTALVQRMFLAINLQNLDAAMFAVDDEVIFNIGTTTGIGKAKLRAYFQSQGKIEYTLSNYREISDIINFSVKASNNPAPFSASSAIVSDGKIQILTLK